MGFWCSGVHLSVWWAHNFELPMPVGINSGQALAPASLCANSGAVPVQSMAGKMHSPCLPIECLHECVPLCMVAVCPTVCFPCDAAFTCNGVFHLWNGETSF